MHGETVKSFFYHILKVTLLASSPTRFWCFLGLVASKFQKICSSTFATFCPWCLDLFCQKVRKNSKSFGKNKELKSSFNLFRFGWSYMLTADDLPKVQRCLDALKICLWSLIIFPFSESSVLKHLIFFVSFIPRWHFIKSMQWYYWELVHTSPHNPTPKSPNRFMLGPQRLMPPLRATPA